LFYLIRFSTNIISYLEETMLNKLIKIASQLDMAGLYSEADQLDILIVKIAIEKQTVETIVAQIRASRNTLGDLSKLIQGIPDQNVNYRDMIEDAKQSDIDFSKILTGEYIDSMRKTLREVYKATNIFYEIESNIERSFRWATDPKSKEFYKKSINLIGAINALFAEISKDLIPAAYKEEIPLPEAISLKWRGVLQGMIGSCKDYLAEFAETKRVEELSKQERGIPWSPKPIPEAELPAETTEELTKVPRREPEVTNPMGLRNRGQVKNRLAEWLKKLYS